MSLGNGKQYELFTSPASALTIAPPLNAEYSDKDFPEGWADIDPYLSYKQLFDGTFSASKIKRI